MAFDAFNVFPRHHLNCFPFPNQQHCSVLIDLAIRYNWPSITFHSKLIFTSAANQRKDGAVCIAGPLKENSGRKPEPGFTVWVITKCGDFMGNHILWESSSPPHRGQGKRCHQRLHLCEVGILPRDAQLEGARVYSKEKRIWTNHESIVLFHWRNSNTGLLWGSLSVPRPATSKPGEIE